EVAVTPVSVAVRAAPLLLGPQMWSTSPKLPWASRSVGAVAPVVWFVFPLVVALPLLLPPLRPQADATSATSTNMMSHRVIRTRLPPRLCRSTRVAARSDAPSDFVSAQPANSSDAAQLPAAGVSHRRRHLSRHPDRAAGRCAQRTIPAIRERSGWPS